MTLRLAAFQHFCARFADAFLTSLNPLTYERGDALQAFEEENEVHEPAGNGARVTRTWIPKESLNFSPDGSIGCLFTHIDNGGGSGSCGHIDPEAVVPIAASASPAPVDGTPPASPGAGLSSAQLDWLEPAVLDVLTGHRSQQVVGAVLCSSSLDGEITCKGDYPDYVEWREHVWDVLRDRLERASKPK